MQTLGLCTESCHATTFKAADGGQLHCSERVPALQWCAQDHKFKSDGRVLNMRCYDMILGEDWLEAVSPIWVDYKTKAMRITPNRKKVTLHGIQDTMDICPAIGAKKLVNLIQYGGVTCCLQMCSEPKERLLSDFCQSLCSIQATEIVLVPEQIQQLLQQYDHLFSTPSQLPPPRAAGHTIKLLPEAQPVRIRLYHYSPIQKNEIEAQVQQMLQTGVVRLSPSEFASLVLLVRKKDGSWRFCVDYRHLNAITMKHKHPMPVVDELLDETSGAKWFTKLDFSAGYHQIRMAVSDEYKTAFRTHQGLYEFLVMPFGLTNAPPHFKVL